MIRIKVFSIPLAFAAVLSVLVHILLGLGFINVSAPTYDEPVHLATGYQDLVSPLYRLNAMDHPPFAEMWAALPLLVSKPSAQFQNPDLLGGRVYNFSDSFLYKNRLDAGDMLDSSRLWCLVSWAVLLGVGILSWAWRLSGPPGLYAAAAAFAFCPPLFSNSALVTTDASAATFFFLTFWALAGRGEKLSGWVLAGCAMGLALASKFSMFILPPLVVVLLLTEKRIAALRQEGRPRPQQEVRGGRGASLRKEGGRRPFPPTGLILMALTALLCLAVVYRFTSLPLYFKGLSATLMRLGQGRPSFLFGTYPSQGSLLYFPAALAIKTPLAMLLASGLCLGLWLRRPDTERMWVAGPAIAFFLLACFSKTQIGYRHILPIYPFLVVMAACGAAWMWERGRSGRAAAACLGLWLAVSVVRVYPYHLAYFNEAVGGPTQGYRYLVDSNLDWGQGLKELSLELKRRGNPPVILAYFGVADPSYYGIRYEPVGFITNVERREGVWSGPMERVLLAVSATNLQSTYYKGHKVFDWLKERTPVFTAGYSIFLYDLTEDKEGIRHLAGLLRSSNPGRAEELLLK